MKMAEKTVPSMSSGRKVCRECDREEVCVHQIAMKMAENNNQPARAEKSMHRLWQKEGKKVDELATKMVAKTPQHEQWKTPRCGR